MSNNLIIDGKPVEIVMYKGIKVLTTRTMAMHHGLDTKVLNQKFRRNKKHFVEGVDYFALTKEMVTDCDHVILSLFYHESGELFLFTESGYLRFVKTINDDKAWHIYGQLMNAYFEKQSSIQSGEVFLIDSKKNRNTMTATWKQHGAKDYASLTVYEYYSLFRDVNKRKPNMTGDELTLLSAFEFIESKKLSNNPAISGDEKIKESTYKTAIGLMNLIAPENE